MDTNPARSLAGTAVLPMACASERTRSVVPLLVARPLMTSTSFITGTGLKKCMPMNRSARSPTLVASSVIEIEEVFEARMVDSPTEPARPRKMSFLTSARSTTASITTCAPWMLSRRSV